MTRVRRFALRLHGDQSGNVYVLYIAAALLLVAMLWAIIGAGARLVQHETVQTSADATAYASAVIRAKGLNVIAFCNLLLAALFGLLVVQRLLYFACLAAGLGGMVIGGYELRLMNAMRSVATMERAVASAYSALALAEAARTGTHDEYRHNHGGGPLLAAAWPMPATPLAVDPPRAIPLGGLCDTENAIYPSYVARISWPAPPDYGLVRTQSICDPTRVWSPLVLAGDFAAAGRYVRGYTLLVDATVASRRRATSVASAVKAATPTETGFVAGARAEVYAFGGAEDLWHMDWRARLVPYAPGDLSDRAAAGVMPDGDVAQIARAVARQESSAGWAAFAADYLQH